MEKERKSKKTVYPALPAGRRHSEDLWIWVQGRKRAVRISLIRRFLRLSNALFNPGKSLNDGFFVWLEIALLINFGSKSLTFKRLVL